METTIENVRAKCALDFLKKSVVMEITAKQLQKRYQSLGTEELLKLYGNGELSEVALSVLKKELIKRGLGKEQITQHLKQDKSKQLQEAQEKSLRTIRNALLFFYFTSVLTIAVGVIIIKNTSAVILGIVVAGLALTLQFTKNVIFSYALFVLFMFSFFLNFYGRDIGSIRIYGSAMLSFYRANIQH